jgi:hypothetical protein
MIHVRRLDGILHSQRDSTKVVSSDGHGSAMRPLLRAAYEVRSIIDAPRALIGGDLRIGT